MKLQDLLLMYSEWLDGEGLMEDPADTAHASASHEDLAALFLAEHERAEVAQEQVPWDNADAGLKAVSQDPADEIRYEGQVERKQPLLGLATTAELIEELGARVDIAMIAGESWPQYKTASGDDPVAVRSDADPGFAVDKVLQQAPEISTFPKGY